MSLIGGVPSLGGEAREPRRKLAADDRLTGPGIACLAAGFRPLALADAMAAALNYADPNDPQATDLQREIELLGPEEVLARLGSLDPQDELVQLVGDSYEYRSVTTELSTDDPTGRRVPTTQPPNPRRRAQKKRAGSRRLQVLDGHGFPTTKQGRA